MIFSIASWSWTRIPRSAITASHCSAMCSPCSAVPLICRDCRADRTHAILEVAFLHPVHVGVRACFRRTHEPVFLGALPHVICHHAYLRAAAAVATGQRER